MQINGITVSQPQPEIVVLPFNGTKLVIKAQYIPADELKKLDELLPEPKPPMISKVINDKPQPEVPDFKDKKYQEKIEAYHLTRMAWIYIESLRATESLEWDTVDMEDPSTWANWSTDLENTGLPNSYIIRISQLVADAQGWNPERIEEATKNFLAGAPVE